MLSYVLLSNEKRSLIVCAPETELEQEKREGRLSEGRFGVSTKMTAVTVEAD